MTTLLQNNFIEITLRHVCSPVNLLHIFRIPVEDYFCLYYAVATSLPPISTRQRDVGPSQTSVTEIFCEQ